MRMGTFLMGGILGAAAVLYFSRTDRPMLLGAVSRAGETVGQWMDHSKDIEQMSEANFAHQH